MNLRREAAALIASMAVSFVVMHSQVERRARKDAGKIFNLGRILCRSPNA
jgi:hypothetical protein